MSLSGRAVGRHRKTAALAAVALTAILISPALSGRAGAAATDGFVRLGHFALGTGPVDEYVDGVVVAKAVAYTQVTSYSEATAGPHAIALRPAGAAATAQPLTVLTVSVAPAASSTIAIVAGAGGIVASVYPDDLSAPPAGTAKVRLIHAVAAIPAVNVFVSPAPAPTAASPTAIVVSPTAVALPSSPAFANLAFGAASPYGDLTAGSYEVDLQAADTGQVVLAAHSWPVAADTIASVVMLQGDQGVTLEVLRDAAGTLSTPAGAMATGAGGSAHGSGLTFPGGLPLAAATLVALAAMAATIVLRRRDHALAPAAEERSADGADDRPWASDA
jgi:hypothetical protein